MPSVAKILFGFHSLYEAAAGYTNIMNPEMFGKALGETSAHWQGALGFSQLALAMVTLLFIEDTGTRTGAKASAVALTFHGLVTGRMARNHVTGVAAINPSTFFSHLGLCFAFVSHIATAWPKKVKAT